MMIDLSDLPGEDIFRYPVAVWHHIPFSQVLQQEDFGTEPNGPLRYKKVPAFRIRKKNAKGWLEKAGKFNAVTTWHTGCKFKAGEKVWVCRYE